MRKIYLTLTSLILTGILGVGFFTTSANDTAQKEEINIQTSNDNTVLPDTLDALKYLYTELGIENQICFEAFETAVCGCQKINPEKKILTIIDYSKSSLEERLAVVDLEKEETLFTSVVAHGQNSGENYATRFSNKNGSHQSSLGFFLTRNTYQGSNGYSLRLDGLERGINDNALARAIVMHGADYADPQRHKNASRLGRSWGCPALPHTINREVIDTIKEGSVLFIYADCDDYFRESQLI